VHEALSDLEKVTIWLKRSKVNIKHKSGVRLDFNLSRPNVKWIFALFSCFLVDNRQ
jgi:hypothetical protein